MGSNSNRSESKSERIERYGKEVRNTKDISSSSFQLSTGAKIRGEMGIEKGNQFIKEMNKYK